MIAPKPKRVTRDRSQLVRLTADERARMDRLVSLYGGTRSDVLRAGIGALEREHATTRVPSEVVHVLIGGAVVCGFSSCVPGAWPHGHRWVRAEEWPTATCRACRAIFTD